MILKTLSFKGALAQLRATPLYRHPSSFLWRKSLSIRSQFCEAVVHAGFLSWEQMLHAACRYCLGATTRAGVIFWQIDSEGRVHDGKVMYYRPDGHRDKSKAAHPTWVSAILARRYSQTKGTSSHCLFGLHLVSFEKSVVETSPVVCIVESEKSAFILSELYPQCIWLATGGLGELQPDKFRPLRGCRVVLFPDTDPEGIAFRRWSEAATQVMQTTFWEDSPPIRVSPLLELHATADQKEQKIDLVDYIFSQGNTI